MTKNAEPRGASCFYAGAEYSDGAVVCQGGRFFRCNDGIWQDTGDPCEGGPVQALAGRGIAVNEGVVTPLCGEYTYKKSSTSRFEQKGTATLPSFPKIKVSSNTIQVVRLTASPGQLVLSTQLKGTGGNFAWADPGTYSVQPGDYDHFVNGRVVGNGYIEAVIEYD